MTHQEVEIGNVATSARGRDTCGCFMTRGDVVESEPSQIIVNHLFIHEINSIILDRKSSMMCLLHVVTSTSANYISIINSQLQPYTSSSFEQNLNQEPY